jgi:5-deoxy-glucuronate isomerase
MTATTGLHRPAGTLAGDGLLVRLTPEDAGWAYCGLRVVELAPGGTLELDCAGEEVAVLPLRGSLEVLLDGEAFAGERYELAGRDSVFSGVSDWCYLPMGISARLVSAAGCLVALPSARATRRLDPVLVTSRDVPVEVRGAGPATRQVNNFMAPEVFPGADKLMCVEVLTPDGNWSSYPPHRHDDSPECPVSNEEIYYFAVERGGFGLHRTYTPDGSIDEQAVVRDGDVFVIPRGYHGPTVAAPGYPLYYLNVLAGPGATRSMAFCDDPAHAWVRDSWAGMAIDPRCPMTGAAR